MQVQSSIAWSTVDDGPEKSVRSLQSGYRMVMPRMLISTGAIRGCWVQGCGNGWKKRIGAFASQRVHLLFVISGCVCRSAPQALANSKIKSDIQLRVGVSVLNCFGAGPQHTWEASCCCASAVGPAGAAPSPISEGIVVPGKRRLDKHRQIHCTFCVRCRRLG